MGAIRRLDPDPDARHHQCAHGRAARAPPQGIAELIEERRLLPVVKEQLLRRNPLTHSIRFTTIWPSPTRGEGKCGGRYACGYTVAAQLGDAVFALSPCGRGQLGRATKKNG